MTEELTDLRNSKSFECYSPKYGKFWAKNSNKLIDNETKFIIY
jgi:hypothetical protein